MPIRACFATLASLAFAILPAQSAEIASATLTASAEASIKVEPDIVLVTLGVVSQGGSARTALDTNSNEAQKLIVALKAAGIAQKNIATVNFSVEPVYAPPPVSASQLEAPRITGYRVTNQLGVRIEGVARSGELLDRVIAAGANRVSGLSFDIDDPAPLRESALKDAIKEANRKAEMMAEAAGVKLLRLISLTTGEEAVPLAGNRALALARASVPIAAGERTVSASATLVFEIAPK